MEREFNRANLRGLHRMLFEIAKGNLAFQIKRTKNNDELEALLVVFNLTAQRLNRNRNQFLWFNRHNEVVLIRIASFLLNKNLEVIDYIWEGELFDQLTESRNIKEEDFEKLLLKKSLPKWKNSIRQLSKGKQNFVHLQLQYEFYELLKLSLPSVIIKVLCEDGVKFIVNSSLLDIEKDNSFNLRENATMNKLSIWDQQLLQNIEEYIMDHLKEQLKPIYEIASLYHTNEHKIKTGFKKIFDQTPHQFHKEQRIEQCKVLIINTDLTLKEIAQKMGFKSYPNFSQNFKNITKMTPRRYRKLSRNS